MTKDEMDFEIRQIEMREKSKYTALSRELVIRLGLEIDGIEDILEYLPSEAVPSVAERIARMRTILNEIGPGAQGKEQPDITFDRSTSVE